MLETLNLLTQFFFFKVFEEGKLSFMKTATNDLMHLYIRCRARRKNMPRNIKNRHEDLISVHKYTFKNQHIFISYELVPSMPRLVSLSIL